MSDPQSRSTSSSAEQIGDDVHEVQASQTAHPSQAEGAAGAGAEHDDAPQGGHPSQAEGDDPDRPDE